MEPATALKPGSLILVTGANGYIASHIVDQAILAGYRVRGTTRDIAKCEWQVKRYGADKFEAVVVKDMADEGAFDSVMEGVSGVVHAASVLTFSSVAKDVVEPVIAGAVNILHAAARHPDIKRVVYTSSSIALVTARGNDKYHVDVNTWNDEAVKLAAVDPDSEQAKHPSQGVNVYGASKTLAERKCWEFVKEAKPGFVLNCVNPNFNMGQILEPTQPASSGGMVRNVWQGANGAAAGFKSFSPQWFIDVKDTARLHVAALAWDDVQNERLLGFAEPFNYTSTYEIMKKIDPSRDLPSPAEDEAKDLSTVDTARSVELLKRFGRQGFTSYEQAIRENLGVGAEAGTATSSL